MRERIFWLVVTFHTTAAAMAMEALCKADAIALSLLCDFTALKNVP